jgi:hypothetical protein
MSKRNEIQVGDLISVNVAGATKENGKPYSQAIYRGFVEDITDARGDAAVRLQIVDENNQPLTERNGLMYRLLPMFNVNMIRNGGKFASMPDEWSESDE